MKSWQRSRRADVGGELLAAMSFTKAWVELGCQLMVTALLPRGSDPDWEAMLMRIASGKLEPSPPTPSARTPLETPPSRDLSAAERRPRRRPQTRATAHL